MQSTFVMIKPDAMDHGLSISIITELQTLRNVELKEIRIEHLTNEQASELYAEHKDKWFFDRNVKHVTSGLVVLMHIRGENVVESCREFVKQYRQIHNDKIELPCNLIHATDHRDKVSHELKSVGFSEDSLDN